MEEKVMEQSGVCEGESCQGDVGSGKGTSEGREMEGIGRSLVLKRGFAGFCRMQ
jgi:hypothetical protein